MTTLGVIALARVTVIIAIGIGQRNDEVVDLIQRALHRLSAAEGHGHRFSGFARGLASCAFSGQHGALQGAHVGVPCADARQVSCYGVAGGAFSRRR